MNTQPFPSHISARLRLRSLLACASLLALAAPLAMAQLFSGIYTFENEGNVTSFPYNGTSITDLTVGNLVKTGITSSSSMGNYRGSNWPTGATTGSDVFTGALDTGKYIEFSLTAAPGKLINLPTLTFGIGRSDNGPRQWQWRSSVDNFTNPIPVTTVNGSLTHDAGVLTNPDSDSSWSGNIITTSTAAYQNLTSITFRLYGYNSETTAGTAGLQGDLTFSGTLVDTAGILTVSVNPASFSESASNPAATGTLSRTGDLTDALEVNLLSSDTTEATIPATVIIPANQSEVTFPVTAVDDNLPDGDIPVIITATATGYTAGNFQVTVLDDGDPPPVLISQYYEGELASNRYIELHNTTFASVSLNGLVLTIWTNAAAENWKSTGNSPSSQLALPNVVIPAGGYYLIVGSGSPTLPSYAVANADLINTSVVGGFTGNDSVVLYQNNIFSPANIYDAVSLTNSGNEGANKSFYRLTNGLGYNLDSGSNITNFPAVWGTKTLAEVAAAQLGDPWILRGSQDPLALALSISPAAFLESAANPAAVGTVTIPAALASELTVNLTSNDTTEATVPASVVIPAGQTSVNFNVTAVDDGIIDGPQTVTITATATGYVNGSFSITVEDDGEVPPPATLAPGAIAFVGYNADGNKDLAFVTLAPVAAGDVIHFTDNEWNGSEIGLGGAFADANEGFLTWTAPQGGVAAGTVVTLNSVSVSGSRSANIGAITAVSGTFNPGASGETIYAFQGSATVSGATGFLAVVANTTADSTDGTGLSASNAVYLANADIGEYIGSRSSQTSFAAYLALIVDTASNWITQTGGGDQSNDGTAPDVPFNTTPFTLSTGGNTFADWIGGYPAVGGLTGFNDDFDNDGLANALENVLGSSPAVANQGLTSVVAGAGTLSFRHTRNTSPASDLAASYEWSVNLANWNASGASVGGTTVTFAVPVVITPGMEGAPDLVQVTATVSGTPATKVFARLRVNQVAAP